MHAHAQWLEWRGLVQEQQSGQEAGWHLTVPACAAGVAAMVPHLATTVSKFLDNRSWQLSQHLDDRS